MGKRRNGEERKGNKKRREFLEKLKERQSVLKIQAATNKQIKVVGKALGGVGELKLAVDSIRIDKEKKGRVVKAKVTSKRLRNKTRQKILVREVNLFSKVLQHPSFKENPCSAVSTHLKNTFGEES